MGETKAYHQLNQSLKLNLCTWATLHFIFDLEGSFLTLL